MVWWCPDPRGVLPVAELHVSRRLERTLRSGRFRLTSNQAFAEVVAACAGGREDGTWIHPEVASCYRALHAAGRARSFEAWRDGRLVGGLFGLPLGRVFCAESMFHGERDASKATLVHAVRTLAQEGVELLEVQFVTPHLASLGARAIPRAEYLARLALS